MKQNARRNDKIEVPFSELLRELELAPSEFLALGKSGAYGKNPFKVIRSFPRRVSLTRQALASIRKFHSSYVSLPQAARRIGTSDNGVSNALRLFDKLGRHPLRNEFLKLAGGEIEPIRIGKRVCVPTKRLGDLERIVAVLPGQRVKDAIEHVVKGLRPPDLSGLPEAYIRYQKAREKAKDARGRQKARLELLEHARKNYGLKDGYTLNQLAGKTAQKLSERHSHGHTQDAQAIALRMFNDAAQSPTDTSPVKRRLQALVSCLVALHLPPYLEYNLLQGASQNDPQGAADGLSRVLDKIDHTAYSREFDDAHVIAALNAAEPPENSLVLSVQRKHFPQNHEMTNALANLDKATLKRLFETGVRKTINLSAPRKLNQMLEELARQEAEAAAEKQRNEKAAKDKKNGRSA